MSKTWLAQLLDPSFLLLVLLGAANLLFNQPAIAAIVMGLAAFNAILGVVGHRQAREEREILVRMTPRLIEVMRNGDVLRVPAEELVPGDVVVG